MIADQLRTATAEKHKELEQLMFVDEIMNHTLSIEDYKKLLTVNYIIHQKLENKLANMLDATLANRLEMNLRFKLSALEKDLDDCGIDSLTLPGLDFELFIPNKNTAEVLGALYVLEGATLGGNVIKKHILANPNFSTLDGKLHYYGVYGEHLGLRWKTFVQILNESVEEAEYDACINSANAMFDNLIKLSRQLMNSTSFSAK